MATASESQRFLFYAHIFPLNGNYKLHPYNDSTVTTADPPSISYCTNTSNSVVQSANINCHWVLLWFSLNPDSISTSISLLAFLYLWKCLQNQVLSTLTASDLGGHIGFNARKRVGCMVSRGLSFPTIAIEPQRHIKLCFPW